ncbi:hypothetical protein LMG33818_002622 [Halomonadaceae bacterium LMG 33818]|uniref:phage baseplate assembly protein V n=1 Tax=Cernens ardua TaxID=3402176 RepID=UPI003EDC03CD
MNPSNDIYRLIQNLIRIGQVFALDLSVTPPCVRVQCGDMQTDWLPWTASRVGGFTTWLPPVMGETVMLLAPSGDPAGAYVIASLYSPAHGSIEQSGSVIALHASDGTYIRYDRQSHELEASVNGTATVTAKATTINGPVTFNDEVTMKKTLNVQDTITSDADVVASGISLKGHTHGEVKAGPDSTGAPQ